MALFSKIFYEKEMADHPRTQKILESFSHLPQVEIEKVDDIFGRVKKPYLQKRTDLQLFLGKKRGTLIKEAPDAYGVAGDPHYYFIHAFNCIYECEYCYLQGYFQSPDIVLFLNHEDIGTEIREVTAQHPDQTTWFHAGEFSDSLALTHLTDELPYYFNLFRELPTAKLELRTKSANIKELLKLEPVENIIVSFSLSPKERIKKTDLKTPPLKARLKAIQSLQEKGFTVALHFDPIIHEDDFESTYKDFFKEIQENIDISSLAYASMGVVRFTQKVFHQVKNNYPSSELLAAEFQTSFDGKVRYPRPFRLWLLGKIKELALESGFQDEQIYLCME